MYKIISANGVFYSEDLNAEYIDEISNAKSEVIDELISQGNPVVLVNSISDFEYTFATKVKRLEDGED